MEAEFSLLSDELSDINKLFSLHGEKVSKSNSQDIFHLVDLMVDFFSMYNTTKSQKTFLFGLFLPIHIQCISINIGQKQFSDEIFTHKFITFKKHFNKVTENMSQLDFTEYITQLSQMTDRISKMNPNNTQISEYANSLIPHFENTLNALARSGKDATHLISENALKEFQKIKSKYAELFADCFPNEEEYPPDYVNVTLNMDYTLRFYDKVLQIKEVNNLIEQNFISGNYEIVPLNNQTEIKTFCKNCVQYILLEIRCMTDYAQNLIINDFINVCSILHKIIASIDFLESDYIDKLWEEVLQHLGCLSISIDLNFEQQCLSKVCSIIAQNNAFHTILDQISRIIEKGIPTDFLPVSALLVLYLDLRETFQNQQSNMNCSNYSQFKNKANIINSNVNSTIGNTSFLSFSDNSNVEIITDMEFLDAIDNLILLTTSRLLYSKLLIDRKAISSLFDSFKNIRFYSNDADNEDNQNSRDDNDDFHTLEYINKMLKKLVDLCIFPSNRAVSQINVAISLINSIVLAKDPKYIKYIPKSDFILSQCSWYDSLQQQIDWFLKASNAAINFTPHLFIDELHIASIPSFYQFADRQIQFHYLIKPYLMNIYIIFEILPLLDKHHEKYGSINQSIRKNSDRFAQEKIYNNMVRLFTDELYLKEEQENIAINSIPLLISLLYEDLGDNELSFDEAIKTFSKTFYILRCPDILADYYSALEYFDLYRISYPNEISGIYDSLLTILNSFLSGKFNNFEDIKVNQAELGSKINRISKELNLDFTNYFTKIEKFLVIARMINYATPFLSNYNEAFSFTPLMKIITHVNHLRLIKKCLDNVINIEGYVLNPEECNQLILEIDNALKSNLLKDLDSAQLDTILQKFYSMKIVNPQILFDSFSRINYFLAHQIQTSSYLFYSNAIKVIKEALDYLGIFVATSDHIQLRKAINVLNGLITSKQPNQMLNYDVKIFCSTIDLYLGKANSILCLLQIKHYMKDDFIDSNNENTNSTSSSIPSVLDPLLEKIKAFPQNKSLNVFKKKLEEIKNVNNIDQQLQLINRIDQNEFLNAKVNQLNKIKTSLLFKLEKVKDRKGSEISLHSSLNQSKLDEVLNQIEKNNLERKNELDSINEEYKSALQQRDQQFASIENESSDENDRMSIMQLIINNDLNLSKLNKQVIDPTICFLHEQLKEATMANARLTAELKNRQFRVEKAPLPPGAISDLLGETPGGRNWLSNDATSSMSLRGSLKHLQDQREELFRELVIEKNSSNAYSRSDKNNRDISKNSKNAKDTKIKEYLAELDRIANSAETRTDYSSLQVEFANAADNVFFILQSEIAALKKEIELKKKYGKNAKEVQTKNLQQLLKVGIMPNNVH